MKNRRPSRSYGKRKAPACAFGDRHGPRVVRDTGKTAVTSGQGDPWLKDFPVFSVPAVTLFPDGTVTRRP